ncbi:hypothetical protein [Anthocerotibacter panamensis]|uniref:hypothetical protein n=1 Tax=Anthocerotibacter panamensis TaxID=2857077 RepID=UPI001C40534F|nr:hypothetical protein [Anthocerotibacter panamensis]
MASLQEVTVHETVVRKLAYATAYSNVLVARAGRQLMQERIRAGESLIPKDVDRWARDLWRFLKDAYAPVRPGWLLQAHQLWDEVHQSKPCATCCYFYGQAGLNCALHPSGRPAGGTCRDWDGC